MQMPSVSVFMNLPENKCNATSLDFVPQESYHEKLRFVRLSRGFSFLYSHLDPRSSFGICSGTHVHWMYGPGGHAHQVYRADYCDSSDFAPYGFSY